MENQQAKAEFIESERFIQIWKYSQVESQEYSRYIEKVPFGKSTVVFNDIMCLTDINLNGEGLLDLRIINSDVRKISFSNCKINCITIEKCSQIKELNFSNNTYIDELKIDNSTIGAIKFDSRSR